MTLTITFAIVAAAALFSFVLARLVTPALEPFFYRVLVEDGRRRGWYLVPASFFFAAAIVALVGLAGCSSSADFHACPCNSEPLSPPPIELETPEPEPVSQEDIDAFFDDVDSSLMKLDAMRAVLDEWIQFEETKGRP